VRKNCVFKYFNKFSASHFVSKLPTLKNGEKPIVHSDRGCHYRWPGWIDRMEYTGLTRSMSKKGRSPDNAACEGFFGHLKNEMFYNRSWQGVSTKEFIAILKIILFGIVRNASSALSEGCVQWNIEGV
jgi:transposase InsO family protein